LHRAFRHILATQFFLNDAILILLLRVTTDPTQWGKQMQIDGYFAEARRLGLRPSSVPNVFLTAAGDTQHVPDPTNMTPAQRAETIEKIKQLMGVTPKEDEVKPKEDKKPDKKKS
jgi:hypothetical protein